MKIYVRRPEELSNRFYSVDKARSKLANGILSPGDMAWCKGLTEWGPLARVIRFAEDQMVSQMPSTSARSNTLRITASEVGMSCFDLVMQYEDSYRHSIQDLQLSENGNLDVANIWVELISLGVFTIDQAIQAAVKNGLTEEVLFVYRSHLKRLKINDVPDFFEQIKYRFLVYTNVINDCAGAPQTISWRVGEAFAILCGDAKEKDLEVMGITSYENISTYVTRWLNEIGAQNVVK